MHSSRIYPYATTPNNQPTICQEVKNKKTVDKINLS